MSIAVANLETTQADTPLKPRSNDITFKYDGEVDTNSDNDVSITAEIVNTNDVVFTDNQSSKANLDTKTFGVGNLKKGLSSDISVDVKRSSSEGVNAEIKVTFVTTNGATLIKFTSVIY
jgi:hypothetical protein